MKNAKRWNREETSYSIINPRTSKGAKPTPIRAPEHLAVDPWSDPSFIAGLHEWCDVEASLDLMFPEPRMPRP